MRFVPRSCKINNGRSPAMIGEILSNLFPVAGLFVALTTVMWRFYAAGQKARAADRRTADARWEAVLQMREADQRANALLLRNVQQVAGDLKETRVILEKQIKEARIILEKQNRRTDKRVRKVDDRLRRMEPIMAVVQDRLDIGAVPRPVAAGFPAPVRDFPERGVPTEPAPDPAGSEESAEPSPTGSVPQGVAAG